MRMCDNSAFFLKVSQQAFFLNCFGQGCRNVNESFLNCSWSSILLLPILYN
uniref:Uncharacterized protein n=1 Tax=Rhizophora mucronata TaxID=61149 RepID=A0A2P2NW27_RHIMU